MERSTLPEGRQSQRDHFEELLERHHKIVFKIAHMYCRDEETRRDLAQEIRAQLWRSFPGFDSRRTFSTWMYRVALNVAISFMRRDGLRQRFEPSLDVSEVEPVDERAAEAALDRRVADLRRFIQGLDKLNRALMLLYLEDNSYREIAEILGISESNVATKINRLKKRIRKDLYAREENKSIE